MLTILKTINFFIITYFGYIYRKTNMQINNNFAFIIYFKTNNYKH